ncbi:MAG: type I-C CRISPR-associated protein Cas5c [Geobacteraceae bacterium]|nr:type I-C CRISPR-associated protein Cas5c [Geobacteraceae bacterium]
MQTGPPLEVKVWGEFACFTRPEMKAERVSYPVMTPSAARGVLEAIFWKPEFSWLIREIQVLNPIRHFSILRNEVNSKAVVSTAKGWMERGGGYFAEEDRAQRHTLALRDVAYIIKADVALQPHATEPEPKYRDQFRRRVGQGKFYHAPYLGCREFTAFFAEPDGSEQPIDLTDDLGLMLFDLDYAKDRSGRGKPVFFHAGLDCGVLRVKPDLYMREG